MRRNRYIQKRPAAPAKMFGLVRSLFLVFVGVTAVVGLYKTYTYISMSDFMPIKSYQVEGTIKYSDIEQIRATLRKMPKMGFFGTDVDLIKEKIEKVRWISKATISRSWPDKIIIEITEYQPVAIWNGAYFISPEGVLIPMQGDEEFAPDMVQLYGPEGDHELVMKKYIQIRDQLASNDLNVQKFKQNGRRSIEIVLDDDVLVILGRDDVEQRITRLSKYYSALKGQVGDSLVSVDMRYTNGVSVTRKL